MTTTAHYLRDVFPELLKRAQEARVSYHTRRDQGGEDAAQFEAGRAVAWYEAISYMVQQLDAFGIDRESIGVSGDLDIERELL